MVFSSDRPPGYAHGIRPHGKVVDGKPLMGRLPMTSLSRRISRELAVTVLTVSVPVSMTSSP
jgi:hypothetical protein